MFSWAGVPGVASAPPAAWPIESRLGRPVDQPSLIVFVHPRCPCSRASMRELELLMAHCAGRLTTRVLFVEPAGRATACAQTDLWQSAAVIPGVTVAFDADGREARVFRTSTSGDALLYDAAGQLAFHGGITLARGHSGDNPGLDTLESIVLDGAAATGPGTPVFGCELFAKNPFAAAWTP